MRPEPRHHTQKHCLYFSIVIPTKNRIHQLTILIRALKAQRYPKTDFEVIVVNNNSKEDIALQIKQVIKGARSIRIVTMEKPGPSFARNYGYLLARYQHVIFLDDDISVTPNFLSEYALAWHQHPTATLIGGNILPDKRILSHSGKIRKKQEHLIEKYNWIYAYVNYGKKSKKLTVNELLCSATLSVNKKLLPRGQTIFNTKFGATHMGILIFSEDYELCNRMVLEQKEVWYAANITTVHHFSPNRLSTAHVIKSHVLAGAENFLMNSSLSRQYPSFISFTFTHQLWTSIKNIARGADDNYLHQFKDPIFWVFFLSYYTLGPIMHALTNSTTTKKI